MSMEQLYSWLVDEGIRDELDELTRLSIGTELDNLEIPTPASVDISLDWQRLLLAGSILARSDSRNHQEAALRIATGAVTLSAASDINDAGAVLLSKLSNFRAVRLASQRHLIQNDLDGRLGISLRVEAQRRYFDTAVLVESSGQWLPVNAFQRRFWHGAADHLWLSASAPTASGKTFLVLQWLIDRMKTAKEARVAVYLAPTRALVSEIESSLLEILGRNNEIQVCSLPLKEKYLAARAGPTRLILVFTQERFHLMANVLGDAVVVDLLVVDEAHKIGDSQRGVILQDAIERAVRSNSGLQVVFISPATQNPEELLADAPAGADVHAVDSDAPTVLQNLIVAEQVARKPKQWRLSLRQQGRTLAIGTLRLSNSPSSRSKNLAFIAAAAGERGGTLVYANRAADSEEIAELISQIVVPEDNIDLELRELAELARKGVHPQFRLAPLVERGVAFHYGNMPSLIRLEVERLFRAGKIRFLVCTSTLVEGVNLSCRTIVLRGPRKGMGNPMEPHDFWNLAGRAGRWGNEFQGNIICIDPHDIKAWPAGVPARSRYPIKRESDAIVEIGEKFAEYLERRATVPVAELENSERFEPVGAYLLATYLRLGNLANTSLAKRHDSSVVEKLEQGLAKQARGIDIGPEVAARHPGVNALGLQALMDAFRNYPGDVENLLPAPAYSQDSYDRFVTILRRINAHLFPAFLPEGLVPLYALVIVRWLKGFSLASIIRKNIEFHEKSGRKYKLPALIRSTFELVEQIARFKAPKYLSAYVDVLKMHLHAIGRTDLIDDELDIGTQLEFGVSSRTLFSLMELGVSRMSAVALYEKIARDNLNKEECLSWVAERDALLDGMDIPSIIVREIREKLLYERHQVGATPP